MREVGRKNLSKGVKVEVGEKETAIDLYIIVEYGVRIPRSCMEYTGKRKKSSRVNDRPDY